MYKNLVIVFLFLFLVVNSVFSSNGKILFDATHSQTAGSADWVIDGGYSDFAATIESNNYDVNSQNDGNINATVLKDFDVLVIPEPNGPLRISEINDIKSFLKNGGGLLLISDHNGADRNHNGYDAVKVFNQFVEAFGFKFDVKSFSEHPMGGKRVEHDAIKGVYKVGAWLGTTMTILDETKAKGLIYSTRTRNPFIVAAQYGKGKIVAIGDSSPFDDGTKKSGSHSGLHDNYNMKNYDHHVMAASFIRWLCQNQSDFPDNGNNNTGDTNNDDNSNNNDNGTTNDNDTTTNAPLYDENGKLNINVANAKQLDAIRGIGKSTAARIIKYRELYGPFENIQQLLQIPNVDKNAYKMFKEYICAL